MTGINLAQLKYLVVKPTLARIGHLSNSALNQVTGTALAESDAEFLQQNGGGPALSFWQIEPETEQDIWTNCLAYQSELAASVRSLLAPGETTPQLVWNMAYAAAICRIKYLRSPLPLPAADDAAAMAAYHKQIYNSALGAANPTTNIPLFQAAIDA